MEAAPCSLEGNDGQDAFVDALFPCKPDPGAKPWWMCRYRHSVCSNPRAFKLDGSLHQLCQTHRMRANLNQRRSQERRRARRFCPYEAVAIAALPVEQAADFSDLDELFLPIGELQSLEPSDELGQDFELVPLDDVEDLLDVLDALLAGDAEPTDD